MERHSVRDPDRAAAESILALQAFQSLVEFDGKRREWTARCLETGATATGSTPETAVAGLLQALTLDIKHAAESNSTYLLFHSPADSDVWDRCRSALTAEASILHVHPGPARQGLPGSDRGARRNKPRHKCRRLNEPCGSLPCFQKFHRGQRAARHPGFEHRAFEIVDPVDTSSDRRVPCSLRVRCKLPEPCNTPST